jgi:hypothetical protein
MRLEQCVSFSRQKCVWSASEAWFLRQIDARRHSNFSFISVLGLKAASSRRISTPGAATENIRVN